MIERQKRARQIWLLYLNDAALRAGCISEREYNTIRRQILSEKRESRKQPKLAAYLVP